MRASRVLSLGLLAACAPPGAEDPLQQALDNIVRDDPSVPGVLLVVRGEEVDFSGSAGYFSFDEDRPLASDDLFRAATLNQAEPSDGDVVTNAVLEHAW